VSKDSDRITPHANGGNGVGSDARSRGDLFDRVTRFIKEVGFPIAVAAALIAYMFFIGSKTNEHLAKGSEIMTRAVQVLEKMERRLP